MSYIQLKIQNNQASITNEQDSAVPSTYYGPKNPARNSTQKVEPHIIQV